MSFVDCLLGTPSYYLTHIKAHIFFESRRVALSTQRFSLRLMDAVMLYAGFRWQQADETKREEAPDYLFGPVEGDDRIEGGLDKWSFSRSLSSWLDLTRARSGGSSRGGVIGPDHPKSKAVSSVRELGVK
jgi:hypothetical protein